MNPNHSNVIAFCAKMEQKLDERLFQSSNDDERKKSGGSVLKGATTAAGAVYGGSVLKRGLAPLVADRRAGMRATIPGFTQRGGLGQTVAATGSVLRDKPLQAARAVGSTIAGDVGAVARAAGRPVAAGARAVAGVGGTLASEAVKTARAVPGALGIMGRDVGRGVARVTTPILARLRGLAGKLMPKG